MQYKLGTPPTQCYTLGAQAAGALYGLLLAGELVAALAQPRAAPLDAADLLLLSSFVRRTGSFAAAAESFSPVCLPRYNASAFLHAYVAYLDPARAHSTSRPPCSSPAMQQSRPMSRGASPLVTWFLSLACARWQRAT